MRNSYDRQYQTINLFGDPYQALIEHYSSQERRGKLLDLGCGQGRDAIALARMGYDVLGIDSSEVGIQQLNAVARTEGLPLVGKVGDIYKIDDFDQFDFILMDSMFHFRKSEIDKEVGLIKKIINQSKVGTRITICIQDESRRIQTLYGIVDEVENVGKIHEARFDYKYLDHKSGHSSITPYRMVTILKEKT